MRTAQANLTKERQAANQQKFAAQRVSQKLEETTAKLEEAEGREAEGQKTLDEMKAQLQQAMDTIEAVSSNGMKEAGYNYITLDDCFFCHAKKYLNGRALPGRGQVSARVHATG